VRLCEALAVPDDVREEEVKVVVMLEPGAALAEEELIEWCAERLARFKVPRYVELISDGSTRVAR
jgi:crotonobetaine/carnitine-CoA ligase